jgi:hypothetical protein
MGQAWGKRSHFVSNNFISFQQIITEMRNLITGKPASHVAMTCGFFSHDDIPCKSGHHEVQVAQIYNNFVSFQQIITDMSTPRLMLT